MRAGGRAAVLAASLAGAIGLLVAPVGAQSAPGPSDPAPIDLVEVLSPTLSTLCGYVQTAVSLVPVAQGLLGFDVPPEVLETLGPVFTLCAAVPVPPLRRSCVLETEIFLALSPVVESLTGLPLPIEPTVIGLLGDQLVALDHLLPTLGSTLAGTLDQVAACSTDSDEPTPTTPPTATTTTIASAGGPVPPAPPALGPSGAVRPLPPGRVATPPATVTTPTQLAAATPITPASVPFGDGPFRYPIVFLAPVALLVAFGAIGRSLSEPLGDRRSRP